MVNCAVRVAERWWVRSECGHTIGDEGNGHSVTDGNFAVCDGLCWADLPIVELVGAAATSVPGLDGSRSYGLGACHDGESGVGV